MKLKAMLTIAAIAAVSAQAKKVTSNPQWDLIVYMDGASMVPRPDLWVAQSTAAKMFSSAGIRIHWRTGAPANSQLEREGAVAIGFVADAPDDFKPGVTAYALPYEKFHITVMYNRLSWLDQRERLRPIFLAHVLVHEITHILQGICRHSESGVMKPLWTPNDYGEMTYNRLPFTADDIVLLQKGVAKRGVLMTASR